MKPRDPGPSTVSPNADNARELMSEPSDELVAWIAQQVPDSLTDATQHALHCTVVYAFYKAHDAGLIVYQKEALAELLLDTREQRDAALAERDELAARLEDTELSLLRIRGEREAKRCFGA